MSFIKDFFHTTRSTGIVVELTGQEKNRSYSYAAYIGLLAG